MEFAHPLSLGMESNGEIASVELAYDMAPEVFMEKMNKALPEGMKITEVLVYRINRGEKIYSLMSLYAGTKFLVNSQNNTDLFKKLSDYIAENSLEDFVSADAESEGIEITVRPGNKKGNLFKILKELTESDFPLSRVDVRVLENYASWKDSAFRQFYRFLQSIIIRGILLLSGDDGWLELHLEF